MSSTIDRNKMTSIGEIRETFSFLDDWETRYKFIIELGRDIPMLGEEYRVEGNLVRGCQSQVWLIADRVNQRLNLSIDSDAHIVRGLIAIVLAVYEGKSPQEIATYPIEELFQEFDLLQHLSPTRGNGLLAMVRRIREVAEQYSVVQ